MKVKSEEEILAFLAPVAEEVGVELVEAKFDQRTRSLTLYIDREEGIDLVTCEKFHRAVDGPLDEFDPTFGESYTLNCSSLGLDRPLRTERDFARRMGEKVEVRLYAPLEGKKVHEGILKGFDGKTVFLEEEGKEREYPFASCAKVSLVIEV